MIFFVFLFFLMGVGHLNYFNTLHWDIHFGLLESADHLQWFSYLGDIAGELQVDVAVSIRSCCLHVVHPFVRHHPSDNDTSFVVFTFINLAIKTLGPTRCNATPHQARQLIKDVIFRPTD